MTTIKSSRSRATRSFNSYGILLLGKKVVDEISKFPFYSPPAKKHKMLLKVKSIDLKRRENTRSSIVFDCISSDYSIKQPKEVSSYLFFFSHTISILN